MDATPELKVTPKTGAAMDRKIHRKRWSPASWSPLAKFALASAAVVLTVLLAVKVVSGTGERTLRQPRTQTVVAEVVEGIFHDLIPLRATVVPRDTVYVDAVDGGRVDHVFVQPGDIVEQGQPLIELSNTNLALSVIQQESQINQAISQLQQNEIVLEQNKLSDERALAEIDFSLVRLEKSNRRRESLIAQGATSAEQREEVADELAYYRRLKAIQTESNERQAELRARLLPHTQRQQNNLRSNLDVVRRKLDGLVVRAPVSGRVTAIDLKVGENRNAGDRLAEVTPDSGMKLSAQIDEFYLTRVRTGQTASVDLSGQSVRATVQRVSPQVRNGRFTVELEFEDANRPDLVPGAAVQGRLQLGGDTRARILPAGPFLERTGGNWVFVLAENGKAAERRPIKVGRRTTEQLEILGGLKAGERVITSDYTGLDKVDRVILTD